MNHTLTAELDARKMHPFQLLVIGICVLMSIMDGFDVMVMAFTAADISKEWSLNGKELGFLFSAGLIGMAIGSIFLAPKADKLGRKPLVIFCLTMSSIGMLLSSVSPNPTTLGILRFITGVGIGGVLTSANVIASEYSSKKWRNLAITLQSTGYALGATFGGMIAIYLINHFGWRSVFIGGGSLTLLVVAIVYFLLPESLDFLLSKQPKNALNRINQLCNKLGLQSLKELPQKIEFSETANTSKAGISGLFSKNYLLTTICIWSAFFLVMFGYYFVMSWTPKLLNTFGLSKEDGITVGVLLSAGGIIGTILIGVIAAKFNMAKVQSIFLLLTAVLMPILLMGNKSIAIIFVIGFLIGIVINGCIGGLYALATTGYDASIRATGVGMAIGFGRIGGIISPFFAGYMVDKNLDIQSMYWIYACVFLLSMFFTGALIKKKSNVLINPSLQEVKN